LSRAVRAAVARAPKDTLIIVSADHSHVFTIAGYPTRGNDILGLVVENDANGLPAAAPVLANDDRPYTTLGYQNGPGASTQPVLRADLTGVDTTDKNFLQQAVVPLGSETHAAEDVAIYAMGPYAFLFNGTMEQNAIFHVMAKALNFDTSDLD
jgi:alkaline phosphatase